MDETNHTLCFKNARRNIIDDVLKWIADDSNKAKEVLWVYGLVGMGKSTLATTIALIMRRRNRLGTFFFFSRDMERNSGTLIRTFPYQAAISHVVAIYDNIVRMPLEFQFEKLLSANALKSVNGLEDQLF